MGANHAERRYNRMRMRICLLALLALSSSCSKASGTSTPPGPSLKIPLQQQETKKPASLDVQTKQWSESLASSAHLRAAIIDHEGDVLWAPTLSRSHSGENWGPSKGLYLIKSSNDGQIHWSKHLSDNSEVFTQAIALTDSGKYLLSGSFARTLRIEDQSVHSNGDRDAFVAMFNSEGGLLWLRSLGGFAREDATKIVVQHEDRQIAIGGYSESSFHFAGQNLPARGTASDGFVATFDSEGTPLWAKRFRGIGVDRVEGLAYDQDELNVFGSFTKSLEFQNKRLYTKGGSDLFCARYDSAGTLLWQRSWGSRKDDRAVAIAMDGGELFLLAQVGEGALNLGDGPLSPKGKSDIALWSLDAYGNSQHSLRLGGKGNEFPMSLSAGHTLRVTGTFHGQTDLGFAEYGNAETEESFAIELDNQLRPLASSHSEAIESPIYSHRGATLLLRQAPPSIRYQGPPAVRSAATSRTDSP